MLCPQGEVGMLLAALVEHRLWSLTGPKKFKPCPGLPGRLATLDEIGALQRATPVPSGVEHLPCF